MAIVVVDEADLRRLMPLDATALKAVEAAFTWLSTGRVSMPPVLHVDVSAAGAHRGDVDVKSAFVEGLPRFAVKIASGFHGNTLRGLPSGSGLMVVLSAETGFLEALLLDNGYLTDLRTALAGAVAAKHLAPATVRVAGVVGTGAQARLQVESLRLVRPFERLLVWGRDAGRVEAYRREMEPRLGVGVEAVPSLEALVGESQCVVTTTAAREPLIDAAWLHPGLHLTAMGSDLPGKQELDPRVLRVADRLVCDRRAQCLLLGELQHAPDLEGEVVELGEITSGRLPGRTEVGSITVCDLTGTGVQDTAIAHLALERAEQAGAGTCF